MSNSITSDQIWQPDHVLALWPTGAPQAQGSGVLHEPQLTVHLPPVAQANGCGVIVNPGGGYRILASDHEGLQVARWLNQYGIAAFVLRYRVGPTYPTSVSLLDAQRAVRLVRSRALEFALDVNRIGMLGFSAGGHLALAVATKGDQGDAQAEDPIEQQSSQVNFAVPVYAVTNGAKRGRKADEYTPTDESVNPQTAPCFIVHTHEDAIVPASQATLIYDALLRAGVKAELHIFNDGEHGVGLAAGDPDVAEWPKLLLRWLRRRGLLAHEERCAVRGSVLCAEQPLGLGWLTLIPKHAQHPIARTFLHKREGGEFLIAKENGPIVGQHTLQIHWVSQQAQYDGSGRYSLERSLMYECAVDIVAGQRLDIRLQARDFV